MIASAQGAAAVPLRPDVGWNLMLAEMIVDLPVMHAAQIANLSLTAEPPPNPGRIITEKTMSGKAVTIGLSMGGKDGKDGIKTINIGVMVNEIGAAKVSGAVKNGNRVKVPTKAVAAAKVAEEDKANGASGDSLIVKTATNLMRPGANGPLTRKLLPVTTALDKPRQQLLTRLPLPTSRSQSPPLVVMRSTSTRTFGPKPFTTPSQTLSEFWQSMRHGLRGKLCRSQSRRTMPLR